MEKRHKIISAVIFFSTLTLALVGKCNAQTKESKQDSSIIIIPKSSQKKIEVLQEQIKNLNDKKWIEQQTNFLSAQATTIYETLIEAKEIDKEKIDWQKTKIEDGKIIVKLKKQ